MTERSLEQQMANHAAAAVELTSKYFHAVLDYSEASVATLESLVEDIHYAMPNGKTAANTDLLCRVWGAYLGEVFRRHSQAEWIAWEDEHGRTVALRTAGIQVFPFDKIRKRILGGPEHDLGNYYRVFRSQMDQGQ